MLQLELHYMSLGILLLGRFLLNSGLLLDFRLGLSRQPLDFLLSHFDRII